MCLGMKNLYCFKDAYYRIKEIDIHYGSANLLNAQYMYLVTGFMVLR